jgi:hypothetical protein
VAAGLVRQLKTQEFRARPAHAFDNRALVVGNPDLAGSDKFDDLPGARQEAQKVAALLAGSNYQVQDCIDEHAEDIIENLHRDAWRILHLAGHGVHEYALDAAGERKLSGMVIGPATLLTPGDIEQMRWVPELVFINCCHLGRSGQGAELARGALAANLGMQFIRMGVRAVIAAGWAVDDRAGAAFADSFYRRMLAGETFGEAVRAAREEIWAGYPRANTWGAYQCYGDPSYRLHRDSPTRQWTPPPLHTPSELVAELDNFARAQQAGGALPDGGDAAARRIAGILERVPEIQREAWQKRADVAAAMGFAWGEVGQWQEAIDWLEKALASAKGDCPIRVLEQCANFKVRLAAERWQALQARAPLPAGFEAERGALVTAIERAILELDLLCQRATTDERLNLLGGACKRLALVETAPNRRKEALVNMAHYYRMAFERTGEAYSFTNWATAQLLALQLDAGLAGPWLDALEGEATRLTDALRMRNELDPSFWDGVTLADLDLVRLLARCQGAFAAPRRRRRGAGSPPPDCAQAVAAIIESYLCAVRRGGSPRELASVREHLDFVRAMSPAGPQLDALEQIREAL